MAAALLLGAGLWLGAARAADASLTDLLQRQQVEQQQLQSKYQQLTGKVAAGSQAYQALVQDFRKEKAALAERHSQERWAFQPAPAAQQQAATRSPSAPAAAGSVIPGPSTQTDLAVQQTRELVALRDKYEQLIDQNGLRGQKESPAYRNLMERYERAVALVEQSYAREGLPLPAAAPAVNSMADHYAGQQRVVEAQLNDPMLVRDSSARQIAQALSQSAEKAGVLTPKAGGAVGNLQAFHASDAAAAPDFWQKVQKIKNGASLQEAGVYTADMSPWAREQAVRQFNVQQAQALQGLEKPLERVLPPDAAAKEALSKFHLDTASALHAGTGAALPDMPGRSVAQAAQQPFAAAQAPSQLHPGGGTPQQPNEVLAQAQRVIAENELRLQANQPRQPGASQAAARPSPRSGLFDTHGHLQPQFAQNEAVLEALATGRSEAQILSDLQSGRLGAAPAPVAAKAGAPHVSQALHSAPDVTPEAVGDSSKLIKSQTGASVAGQNPNSTIRFEPGDFAYGPSAGGKLRELSDKRGGKLLTDVQTDVQLHSSEDVMDTSARLIEQTAKEGQKIRFDLTNMQDVDKILRGEAHTDKVTSKELRYVADNWDRLKNNVVFYETKNGKFQEAVGFGDHAQQVVKQSGKPPVLAEHGPTAYSSALQPHDVQVTPGKPGEDLWVGIDRPVSPGTGNTAHGPTASAPGKGATLTGRTTSGSIDLNLLGPPAGLNQPSAQTGHGNSLDGSMVTDGHVVPARTTGGQNALGTGAGGTPADPARSLNSGGHGTSSVSVDGGKPTSVDPDIVKASGGLFQNQQQVNDYHAAVETWKNTPAKGAALQPQGPSAASFWPQDAKGIRVGERLTSAPVDDNALAWSDDLKKMAQLVSDGKASAEQKQIVRRNNDVINRMASQGEIPNNVYQEVQKDFSTFNQNHATSAAQDAGLNLQQQKSTKPEFTPQTDADYIHKNQLTGKPVDPQQIQQARDGYNARMNQELGTKNVDYAKKFDTDFMADPQGMSAANFTKVAQLNNDAYTRQAAAEYEFNKRNGKPVTEEQSQAYVREMQDMYNKKQGQADHALDDAIKARAGDPTAAQGATKDADAKLLQKMQLEAKYTDRVNQETDRLSKDIYSGTRQRIEAKNLNVVDGPAAPADPTLPHDDRLSALASDRGLSDTPAKAYQRQLQGDKLQALQNSIDTRNRITGADAGNPGADYPPPERRLNVDDPIIRQNIKNAATANALDDHLMTRAQANLAEVKAGLAQQNFDPERLRAAAELGNNLPAARQGELVDNVRLKYGDEAANNLTSQMKDLKIAARPAPGLGGQAINGALGAAEVIGNVQMVAAAVDAYAKKERDLAAQGKRWSAGDVAETVGNASGVLPMYQLGVDQGTRALNNELSKVGPNASDLDKAQAYATAYGKGVLGVGQTVWQGVITDPASRAMDEEFKLYGDDANIVRGAIRMTSRIGFDPVASVIENASHLDVARASGAADRKMQYFVRGDALPSSDNLIDLTKQVEELANRPDAKTNPDIQQQLAAKMRDMDNAYSRVYTLQSLANASGVNPAQLEKEIADLSGQPNASDPEVQKQLDQKRSLLDSTRALSSVPDRNAMRDYVNQMAGPNVLPGAGPKEIDQMMNNAKPGSDEWTQLRDARVALTHGTPEEQAAALQKVAEIQNVHLSGQKYLSSDTLGPMAPDPKTDMSRTLHDLYANATPEERSHIEDLYAKLGRDGPDAVQKDIASLQANIASRGTPNDASQPARQPGLPPLTEEQKQNLTQKMTDDLINKALGLTGEKMVKTDNAPPEPPPDPNADKKQNLKNYLNNVQNGAADTQQKMDDLTQQLRDSHNSAEKKDLLNQLATLQKTKDDWVQRANDTKKDLRDLGVDPNPATPVSGASPDNLKNYLNNMQNGSADTQQKINDLRQQYADSRNSTEKKDLLDQLAALQKTKNDWDQRADATKNELRQLGIDPEPQVPVSGASPDSLKTYMNNMQNGAADTQQKINDLLQQYKDSHDSSQKNELRDQLADLYKTKDDWDQRFYDTRKELRQLGLDPDAPTGPGAPAPDGNGNPDKNGGTLAGQNLGNNQTPGQGGGQPGQPNDGQSGMDGNTAQSGQPNPPGAGNPLDGTLTGQLVNLEPAMGDGGNGNIPFLPPLLNGYMAGFDKDRSDQTGSAFVNMQAQAKGQQIAGIPDDVYRQILNQLNTAGNDADNTRNAAATAAAQQQDTTSWGNTVGNAFVDSVTAGGTAMGQTFGGAAAGQVSKFVQDAVSGGPRGGDGGGNGGGGDQAPASGGAGANTAGGGNSTCNDGDKGAGGGGVPPDLNNLGAQAGAQVAGALVGATTLAAGGVKPTADNIKNFTDQNGGGTTGQGGNTPGPQAPTPVKPATTPKPAKPPSSNSQGCICFLDGDHFGSMHYFFGCRVTGKNSSGASFDAKHPVPQPSKCPQCGGSISLFKDIANTVPPPDFSNLKAPEPMKNPSWDQIRNVLDIK